MTDITRPTRPSPEFLRPEFINQQPERPSIRNPAVIAALDAAADIEHDRDRLYELCQRQVVDLTEKDRHIHFLQGELAVAQIKASKFESGFLSVKAELNMIASAGQYLHTACEETIRRAEGELRKAGVDVDSRPAESRVDTQELAEQIGKKFGAGFADVVP